MRTGIADCILCPGVRAVISAFSRIKSKFQEFHSGIAAVLNQLFDRLGHITKILRNDFLLSERFLHRMKELHPRPFLPVPALRIFITVRYGIIFIKAAKMVYPHNIIKGEAVPESCNPPPVACFFLFFPVIKGISPELSIFRKGIRRTSCHRFRAICRFLLPGRCISLLSRTPLLSGRIDSLQLE